MIFYHLVIYSIYIIFSIMTNKKIRIVKIHREEKLVNINKIEI